MAKQIDLYKAINKHAKAIKALENELKAVQTFGVSTYLPVMKRYVERKLVKQWNRYVFWLKVKSWFGIKSAKAITGPILVHYGDQVAAIAKSINNE